MRLQDLSEIDFAFEDLFEALTEATQYLNPVGEMAVLIGGAGGDSNASDRLAELEFDWASLAHDVDVFGTFMLVTAVACAYAILGVLGLAGAAATLRRRICSA